VAVNVPHHVTQRGNARQFILANDSDRAVYLELLRKYVRHYELRLLGYCLMSNHVHLVVVPDKAESLWLTLKHTHGRYAAYWNAAYKSSGHAWQGRFYSCPLDEAHLWIAIRYAELNPVRAGLVGKVESWNWSSAAAHCGSAEVEICLDMERWSKYWSPARWKEYLGSGESEAELGAIRKCTHTGRPLGNQEFLQALEEATARRLAPRKCGRPTNGRSEESAQKVLFSEN